MWVTSVDKCGMCCSVDLFDCYCLHCGGSSVCTAWVQDKFPYSYFIITSYTETNNTIRSRHVRWDILVEQNSGADDELEDVLQSLHGLQQLLRQLLSIVHVVLQDFGQLPSNTIIQRKGLTNLLITKCDRISQTRQGHFNDKRVIDSRVSQRGAEMLSDVGLQNGVKVLELSVGYKPNYEHLSENKDKFIKM